MSFQGYLNTIQTKTGKKPDDFRKMAEQKGFTQNGQINVRIKATEIVNWLKADFNLEHGDAMAI